MKKYLLGLVLAAIALPVMSFAATNTTYANPNLSCMQNAVEKRDNAVIEAWDSLHEDMTEALTDRRDALKAAWALSNRAERNSAIKAAWKEFKSARNTARKEFNNARKSAWKTFKSERKACKGDVESGGDESTDTL